MVRGLLGMVVTGIAVTAVSMIMRTRRRKGFRFALNRKQLPLFRSMNLGRILAKAAR